MRVAVVGAGPAGLYFAILMAQTGQHEITVYERNPPGATYGWGVVFSETTLSELAEIDRPAFAELERSLVHWSAIDIRHTGKTLRSLGHGFSAISRPALLGTLDARARALGVQLQYEANLEPLTGADAVDLVVAADGVNSSWRSHHDAAFRPDFDWHRTRFMWLGVPFAFPAFTFIFEETTDGPFQVHAYPYSEAASTFIVETTEETWRRAGLDQASEQESLQFCSALFADHLAGAPLLSNRSSWSRFVTLRSRSWHTSSAGGSSLVLIGDAAHTAHFSIGSGTKLAVEDAASLCRALALEPGRVKVALAAYQAERQPAVARFQKAARDSARYFESVGHHLGLAPETFAFNLLTRSGRVTHRDLEGRDPALTMAADRVVAAQGRGDVIPRPTHTRFEVAGLALANRLVGTFEEAGGEGLVLSSVLAVTDSGRAHPQAALAGAGPEAAWGSTLHDLREAGTAAGLVIGHAGARAACRPPGDGLDRPLRDGGWPTWACSPVPYTPAHPIPHQLAGDEMEALRAAFSAAASWAARIGFDLLMVDAARGGLLAGFLSPLTNLRSDRYGGGVAARLRYPLEVIERVRSAWPGPLAVRFSATDWSAQGTTTEEAVECARGFRAIGVSLVEVVGGGTVAEAEPDYRRGYLVGLAAEIRQRSEVAVLVGGAIASLDEADTAIAAGRADLIRLNPFQYRRPLWR